MNSKHDQQMVVLEESIWENGWLLDGKRMLVRYVDENTIHAISHDEFEISTLEIDLPLLAIDLAKVIDYN